MEGFDRDRMEVREVALFSFMVWRREVTEEETRVLWLESGSATKSYHS